MSADARDDNMFASVTSADSVTEHIEEPREVPESSVSSIFFRQEQCRVILKQYTLKRAGQDNHRHSRNQSTISFSCLLWFWPEEKNNFAVAFTIYPFLHDSELFPDVQYAAACTLFALQVTVNCPRWIWKNMYIVSQMLFIIIQLLHNVACVTVSSLLKSVLFHESNTSSCHHFAIVS